MSILVREAMKAERKIKKEQLRPHGQFGNFGENVQYEQMIRSIQVVGRAMKITFCSSWPICV
jgi:hypothetical protein